VWVDAHQPHHWRIVDKPIRKLEDQKPGERASLTKSASIDQLRRRVRELIAIAVTKEQSENSTQRAAGSHGPHSDDLLQEQPQAAIDKFYAERKQILNLAFWWKLFRDLLGDCKLKMPALRVNHYESAVIHDWPADRTSVVAQTIDRLRPFYAWPDKLADCYADAYRSAFVMAFLAAATAVAFALLPLLLKFEEHSFGEIICTMGELVAIVFILTVVYWGRKKRWQNRWLDYRLLAEMIRHQRLVAHLGGERATPSVPEHLDSYGDPGASWMAWYARAVERTMGLPTAVVDQQHLLISLKDILGQLGEASKDTTKRFGQIGFHQTTSERSHRIEHWLHLAEYSLFALTLACCILHLLQGYFHREYIDANALTFFCGTFPAFGAALAGINNQGEFRRIAKRSKSMQEGLSQHVRRLTQLKHAVEFGAIHKEQLSAEIAGVASEAARMMINEVLDWRVMFHDRPLHTT
jgi:hypothetical protein